MIDKVGREEDYVQLIMDDEPHCFDAFEYLQAVDNLFHPVYFVDKFKSKKSEFIYFLFNEKRIAYIGKTNNVAGRIGQHIRKKRRDITEFAFFKCPSDVNASLAEEALIRIFRPSWNVHFNFTHPTQADFEIAKQIIRSKYE